MNCAEKVLDPLISLNYTPSHQKIQVPKVLGAREIQVYLEFRYQNIVLSLKFRKGFAKFMIWITLFKKFLS